MAEPSAPSPLDARLLATIERAFAGHAGAAHRIDRSELQKALGLRSEFLAGRVLAAFDTNGDGSISREEFVGGVRALIAGSDAEKLRFAFRVHDLDGDGYLSRDEMLRMIAISLAESDTRRATQPPEQLVNVLFAMADRDADGRISFDELEALIRSRPALLRAMTHSEASWIVPNEDLLALIDEPRRAGRAQWASTLEGTWRPALFIAAWAVTNIATFVVSITRSLATDPFVIAGSALGACITLNAAVILIPVMRRLLTRLRASRLGHIIPVDDAIAFHKIIGHALFPMAILHAASFLFAYARGHASQSALHVVTATTRGLTGAILLLVLTVMWAFALGPVRRSQRFELFYFTHLLYVVFFIVAALHAPSFLVIAALPLFGFAVEQALRLRRRGSAVPIVSQEALRSGVVRLEVERPTGFRFGAGDYVFLRIPAIARGEWHPFTISSAPENDTLSFHVRSLGNWTAALREKVESASSNSAAMRVHVDGPYGSPSAPIFQSRFAVLIGAGIGVTPFASVLESIVLRGNGASNEASKLEKAHFFWLNRDQVSFEWFGQLLSRLEAMDQNQKLEIHLCMTAGRSGATSLGLELAREILRAAGRSDIVTGLRTKTHMGQPDWEGWLSSIARHHAPAKVDVYFCGPPGLAAKLRPLAARLGMPFHEERF